VEDTHLTSRRRGRELYSSITAMKGGKEGSSHYFPLEEIDLSFLPLTARGRQEGARISDRRTSTFLSITMAAGTRPP